VARTGGKSSYSREDVIELLAAIYSSGHLFIDDEVDLTNDQRESEVSALAGRLEEKFLGMIDYGDLAGTRREDEAWESDPDELSIRVRESELVAEMIDEALAQMTRMAEFHARAEATKGRPARYRLFAEKLREAGTQKGVYFPSEDEMHEVARERGAGVDAR
jgi:hypothetical protein